MAAIMSAGFVLAKDRDENDRRGSVRNQVQKSQGNLQKHGGNSLGGGNNAGATGNNPSMNRNPGVGPRSGIVGGSGHSLRKFELPNQGNTVVNPPVNNPQGQIGNRVQNAPNFGGGQPVLKGRNADNNLGGPNLNAGGNFVQPGGGQPVLKRRDANKSGGGVNNPNPGGNNPNPNLGGQPVLKRRDNDNKPGGVINNPNLGGGQPVLKRRDGDNKPGGGVIGNPNVNPNIGGNNPLGGNVPRGLNRNPDLKNSLKQFQPNVTKRQENERNLIRNKDHVEKLLNSNPELKNRIQRPDGRLDLSKLHLEHRMKDRIPAAIHKDGQLPINLHEHQDLAQHFDRLGKAKNLDELNQHWKHFQDPDLLKKHPELAKIDWKRASGNFQSQIADPNHAYKNLVVSNVGRQLHLQQQFHLYQRGDVARQMNLNVALINAGGWKQRYVGPVYPGYMKSSFSFWYCGPGYYPAYCWCPTWCPWVDWCWWNTCLPIYDPRPFFCRPIVIYDPCPAWIAYPYPAWQPLPVVACGTWVDLPTPVLAENVDLQLVAVRFVDNGHPDQNLGPRYRVWFQNNSRAAIADAFNVLLIASNSQEATADLPQAGVTIPSMEPGEMKVVDIRLPFAASKMNRVDNHLTPFNYLHVLVDSHRQLNDANMANNGAVLPRVDILPVDPAAFAPDVSAAAPGAVVSIAGEGFGPEPGRLIVDVNGVQTEATIYGWYDLGVQFELPNVAVNGPTDAQVLVVRGDGAASNPVTIRVAPEEKLEAAALPPAPLP
jgi:hypothetical protein